MKTPAKRLAMWAARRRACQRAEHAQVVWALVEEDATATWDPQAIELAAFVGLGIGLCVRRLRELDDDCSEARA